MNIKRRITVIGLICSFMVLIFGGGRSPTTVFADTVEHTHIWIDKYDSVNHWQECSICKTKQNVTVHTFEDHWYVDNSACGGKSSHKVCSCGYAYTYHPEHIINTNWYSSTSSVRCHFRICNNCKGWVQVGGCYNKNGPLSCKNPGKCSLCGGTWSTGRHFLTNGGICADCKQRFYTITNETQIYSADYKTCDCSFDIIPENGVEVIDSSMFPSGTRNYSGFSRNLQKNTDGSYTITWHFVLDEKLATKILHPAWRYDNIRIDGHPCYVVEDYMFSIWMDHTAPVVTNIVQTDQTSHDGWATARRLDISGTEDYADIVVLSIIDKTTQHVVVNDAKIGVTDKKWSYTCTPDLEGGKSGRTYTIRTEDVNGNISNTDFTVYNTDSASPQIESPLSYTDWTNTAKTITLTFTDYGSGDVQASLDNQTSYKACTKTADGKYQITYTFSDDIIGNKTYKLYLRDGLGNAGSYDLVVGNIDKNTYSINYNLNGGTMSGQKTSYTVVDSFTLPQPTRTGYTFTGWTGSNGTTVQKTVTVNKGTRGNLSYTANWQVNTYIIDANGVLDEKGGGNVAGYATIDVYINGKLDAENVTDYYKSQPYGTKYEIRYKANDGYVFVAGGNNGVYSGTITNNVSFYPVFKTKVLTTTFHRNRNSSDSVTATQKYTYGIDGQTFSYNGFDCPGYRLVGYDLNKNAENPIWSVNNGVAQYWIDEQYPANDVYAIWKPISWTTKYDANGGSGTMEDTTHRFGCGDPIRHNQFIRPGWTMTGWAYSRVRNGITEWLYGNTDGSWKDPEQWYEFGKNPDNTKIYVEHNLDGIDYSSTYIDGDIHIAHAQWQYNPVSVKVPQILTGDNAGRSQFRIKCDDIKAGNIKVSVPSSFVYKQTGKADVTATITSKSGSGVITAANKVCVYNITTKNGLSAGCWQGSFNIGLTLTKE